ncbi:hypothetical protein AMS68_001111 [Peltaster fructicola]|uniref:EXPERA domain-containing protein n=1 Tax=Peltaster fructicola TaxID=286661 RepID=A0A6H0XLJ2_9PEZI|nr:hypothetical protein AMS68_001111 [Peltaster fructicola]
MVATRNHPKDFESPSTATDTPTKRSLRSATATLSASLPDLAAVSPRTSSKTRSSAATTPARRRKDVWAHTPSNLTLIWLAISLPLVIWDTFYILLRPYTMPGGSLHYPLWVPYDLYGRVDHVYGWPAYKARNGWPSAQGTYNAFETLAYLAYAYIIYAYGQQESRQGRGAPDKSNMGIFAALSESRTVYGREAIIAVMLAYTTAHITFHKTVLYWLSEAFSGFHSIGHNDGFTLLFLWIIPNGAWLVLPAYMIYVSAAEIIQGLSIAAGSSKSS